MSKNECNCKPGMGTRMEDRVVFAYNIENSFPKRYIILQFICRRLVSFIIILGNDKLLDSVSDTFVNIVFKRHHIKKGREENSVDPKNFKTFDSPKAYLQLIEMQQICNFPNFQTQKIE